MSASNSPPLSDDNKDFLFYLSAVLGWSYFLAWSTSFYGQVVLNYQRKSVKGVSFDFLYYNFTGFTGYSIYTIWGYLDSNIGTGPVSVQDVVFAVHAWLLTTVTIIQSFYYYDKNDPSQKTSTVCKTIITCLAWGLFQILLIERILGLYDPHIQPGSKATYNSVIYLGWCKVFVSLIKYIPQVIKNYKNKSTIGWSIFNIVCDFLGGSLSFGQNIVDTIRGNQVLSPGEQPASLNFAKFALSIISIVFDILFMIQHYCLYTKRENKSGRPSNYASFVNDVEFE